ncbi:MAG: hypothetical protein AAGC74_00700 [Verrucomicrobiota bacterium]
MPKNLSNKPIFRQRARSIPRKASFYLAMRWAAATYLSFICCFAALGAFVIRPSTLAAYLLIALAFISLITWSISLVVRKRAACPLCKGTPFRDTGSASHERALRFYPLNYGTSNLLRALIARRFRCHFCGTPFDFLKEHIPGGSETPENPQTQEAVPSCQA